MSVLHLVTHLENLGREKSPGKNYEKIQREIAVFSTLMMNFLHTENFRKAVNVALLLRLVLGHALHPGRALFHFQGHVRHHTRPRALPDHQLLKVGMSHALLRLHHHAITLRVQKSTRRGRRSREVKIARNGKMNPPLNRKSTLLLIRVKEKARTRKTANDVKNKKVMGTKLRRIKAKLRT